MPAYNPSAARPGWVTFAAVLSFIGAALLGLLGLFAFIGGSVLAAVLPGLGTIGGAIIMFLGFFLLAVAVLDLFIGMGLLKGQGWARITAIVLSGVGLLLGVFALVVGDFSQILGIALNGLVVFGLLRPESAAFFGGAGATPATPTPMAR